MNDAQEFMDKQYGEESPAQQRQRERMIELVKENAELKERLDAIGLDEAGENMVTAYLKAVKRIKTLEEAGNMLYGGLSHTRHCTTRNMQREKYACECFHSDRWYAWQAALEVEDE